MTVRMNISCCSREDCIDMSVRMVCLLVGRFEHRITGLDDWLLHLALDPNTFTAMPGLA